MNFVVGLREVAAVVHVLRTVAIEDHNIRTIRRQTEQLESAVEEYLYHEEVSNHFQL